MSKYSSRSPSKKNSFQIENLLQSSNRESKNINPSNRESKNVNISNLESNNIRISNRDSKNLNYINNQPQNSIKNSISSLNLKPNNYIQNPKSKTEQSYFEIKNELKKELGITKEKNEKMKKKNFVDNLYLKNKEKVNDFLENNQTNINLIGTKEISDIPSSKTIETIKSNQKNWTNRIPGLKYINPEKNKDKAELSLTPLPEKKMGKLWKNEQEKKDYDKAEKEAKVMRKIEYTHAKIDGKREKKDPFEGITKLRVNNKEIKTTKNGIKIFCFKNNPNVSEEDKERYYSVMLQKFFRKIKIKMDIQKRRIYYKNNKKKNIDDYLGNKKNKLEENDDADSIIEEK